MKNTPEIAQQSIDTSPEAIDNSLNILTERLSNTTPNLKKIVDTVKSLSKNQESDILGRITGDFSDLIQDFPQILKNIKNNTTTT